MDCVWWKLPSTLPSPPPTRNLQSAPTRPCHPFCKSGKRIFNIYKQTSWLDGHLFCNIFKLIFILARRSPVCQWPLLVSFPNGPELRWSAKKRRLVFDNNGEFVNINDMGSCVWQRRVCEHHLCRPFIMTKTSSGKRVCELRKLTSSSSKRDSTQAHTQNHLKKIGCSYFATGWIPWPMLREVRKLVVS